GCSIREPRSWPALSRRPPASHRLLAVMVVGGAVVLVDTAVVAVEEGADPGEEPPADCRDPRLVHAPASISTKSPACVARRQLEGVRRLIPSPSRHDGGQRIRRERQSATTERSDAGQELLLLEPEVGLEPTACALREHCSAS